MIHNKICLKKILYYFNKCKLFFIRIKIYKFKKHTLNSIQTVVNIAFDSKERKKLLRKKLKQNKVKFIFEFIVFITFILLTGLYLFLQTIDPNNFRQIIEKSVNDKFKINLYIKGSIKWTVFKMYPAVEINDVSIRNILIDGNYYHVKLGTVRARVSLLSLINGSNVISKVHLKDILIKTLDTISEPIYS